MAIELTMEIVPPTFHQLDLTKLSIIINFTSDARSTIYTDRSGRHENRVQRAYPDCTKI